MRELGVSTHPDYKARREDCFECRRRCCCCSLASPACLNPLTTPSLHPPEQLTFMLDHMAMLTVGPHPRWGVFDCKPLQFIWAKFPGQYGPHNTIMCVRGGRLTGTVASVCWMPLLVPLSPTRCLTPPLFMAPASHTRRRRLDDLRRNYVLNKQQGLVIRPYKRKE